MSCPVDTESQNFLDNWSAVNMLCHNVLEEILGPAIREIFDYFGIYVLQTLFSYSKNL